MANIDLERAKKNKDDEFYTQIEEIESELRHYKPHFQDKTVFCNCDDPASSHFWRYFNLNFEHLGLRRLLATHFDAVKQSYMLEMWRDENGVHSDIKILRQNGDFRSPECIELLKQSDIVVTNPPFSLFREYLSLLIEYQKHFVIIGNQNAVTYKEVFPLIKNNIVWLGYKSGDMAFRVPESSEPRKTRYWVDDEGNKWRSMGNICWFTNLDIPKRHEKLILYRTYNAEDYPKYDNYEAINVNKVVDIPMDYDGIMGVPITFMDKYNPEQFEIIGISNDLAESVIIDGKRQSGRFYINGKRLYDRIAIRRRHSE